MRTCQSCGRTNALDVDFCACGEYLRWDPTNYQMPAIVPAAPEAPPVPATPPAPPVPAAQAPPHWPSHVATQTARPARTFTEPRPATAPAPALLVALVVVVVLVFAMLVAFLERVRHARVRLLLVVAQRHDAGKVLQRFAVLRVGELRKMPVERGPRATASTVSYVEHPQAVHDSHRWPASWRPTPLPTHAYAWDQPSWTGRPHAVPTSLLPRAPW